MGQVRGSIAAGSSTNWPDKVREIEEEIFFCPIVWRAVKIAAHIISLSQENSICTYFSTFYSFTLFLPRSLFQVHSLLHLAHSVSLFLHYPPCFCNTLTLWQHCFYLSLLLSHTFSFSLSVSVTLSHSYLIVSVCLSFSLLFSYFLPVHMDLTSSVFLK